MDFLRWARIHWDRVVAVVAALAGAVALFVGWNGASQTAYPAEQLPYLLSGGLVGLFLFGAGATLWLSADLRDEWGELRGIREELRAARQDAVESPPADAVPANPPPPAGPADAEPGAASRPHDAPSDSQGAPAAGNGASVSSVTELARSKRA
jgi:hypothetical protein